MTDTTDTTVEADRALKAKHRAMWAAGDYNKVAADFTVPLGRTLVQAAALTEGDRVLDVAAGTGAVAIPAARAGAHVTAADLTPELLDHGRAHAARYGVHIEWDEADAEALPYADHAFDVVLSSIGVMFAPRHQQVADELVRTTRPGGTIGLLAWTPEGFLGQLMATVKPYVPAPPPGAQPTPLWGTEAHLQELFADRVTNVRTRKDHLPVHTFSAGEEFRDYFKTHYGPIIGAYKANADDDDAIAGLDRDLADVARRHDLGGGAVEWEYLLFTAQVAA